jgi:cation diffusion facilitator family transporter
MNAGSADSGSADSGSADSGNPDSGSADSGRPDSGNPDSGSAPESLRTVVIAFAVNALVALAKSVAAVITGSASMVAEAAHSWADTGNEVLLVIAERRSRRPSDEAHPQGHGKEAYIWSLFAAFGLFTVGAVVSVTHGVQELLDPEPAGNFVVAYAVLGISAILEGISFRQALGQAGARARERGTGTLEHVLETSNPTLRAVFAEDAAALIGLGLAFLGILLHQLTGSAVYDALGSICVGILLAVVAVILIDRNRRFLVGESIDADTQRAVLGRLLDMPDIDRITYLHVEFVGPSRLFLVAAVDIVGNLPESEVALELRRIENQLEQDPRIAEVVLTLSTPGDPALTA